jgi:hypothetical protein
VRDENIVIYAIGIGGYNLQQLQDIASSESHVHTLATFTELEKFISTLTSSTCYEPRPISLNQTIETDVEKDVFLYFSYKVNRSLNLELKIDDINGVSVVYASRTSPHPFKFDNDLAFEHSNQKNKLMVISPKQESAGSKRFEREIFVAITSKTDAAEFSLRGNECNPFVCTEGTNEINASSKSAVDAITATLMVASFIMLMILF